jgi:acetyl esterase/lipase
VPIDAETYLQKRRNLPLPPLLMISAEHDLDYVVAFSPEVERLFRKASRRVEWAQVPKANHYYSFNSMTGDGQTVFHVIKDSVASWVGMSLG